MNKIIIFILALGFSLTGHADWTQKASSLLGSNDKETTSNALDYAKGLLPTLTAATGTSNKQAQGGVGSLFAMAKDNLNQADFAALTAMLPDLNMDTLLAAAPAVADKTSQLSGMLGADSGNALGGAQKIYDQFKALGLDAGQVGEYIDITQGYLQSAGGQSAVDLFKKGLGALAAS